MRFTITSIALLLTLCSGAVLAQDKEAAPPALDVSASLHALWAVTNEPGEPTNELSITRARFRLDWQQDKWLHAKLQFDIDDLFDGEDGGSLLRDAYVEIRFFKALRVRMGQFKRPFSALENRGRSTLEVVDRGPSNDFLIEDLGFGDRDLGIQVRGRFGNKDRNLAYYFGIFNGAGRNNLEMDDRKDLVGRVEVELLKGLTVGANASFKFFDVDVVPYVPEYSWMTGVDVSYDRKGLFVLAEGLYGLNHDRCDLAESKSQCRADSERLTVPTAVSAVVLAAYKFWLYKPWRLKLEPTVKGEMLRPDDGLTDGLLWQASVGANLHLGKHLRVMVHGDVIEAGDGLSGEFQDEMRLLVQLAARL